MINKINTLTIVGGGTSGWLTAAFISRNIPEIKITLIDKEETTPVGVGEGTLTNFELFLHHCGFTIFDWVEKIDATPKSGILFPGWKTKDKEIWHPFDLEKSSYNEWSQNQQLDFRNTCLGDSKHFDLKAWHVDCGKLVKYIEDKIKDKITIIKSDVVNIVKDSREHIKELVLKNEQTIQSDLFVDCTGFKGLLRNKPDRKTLEHRLICDTAIAAHISYKDKEKELNPYVISEAVDCGWIWNIPVQTRIGSGIVFNRSITKIEDAKKTLIEYWDNRINEDQTKIIDWTPYYNTNQWHENVVEIGLSAGFIEPLESTGVALIMEGIIQLTKRINPKYYSSEDIDIYNNTMKKVFETSIDFVNMHYVDNQREEPFWKEVQKTITKSDTQKFYESVLLDENRDIHSIAWNKYQDINFFTGMNWMCWLIQLGYPVKPRKKNDFDLTK